MNSIKDSKLRKFGIMIGAILWLLGILPMVKGKVPNFYLISPAAIFLLAGLLKPAVLSPVYRIWIRIGEVLGRINSFLILSVIFYVILTPIGIMVRLFTNTTGKFKYKTGARSYWIKMAPIDFKESMKQMF